MRFLFKFTALLLILSVGVADVWAQSRPKSGSLSQLEFDKKSDKKNKNSVEDKLDFILGEKADSNDLSESVSSASSAKSKTPKTAPPAVKPDKGKISEAIKAFENVKSELPREESLVVPALGAGPKVDKDDAHIISSKIGWGFRKGAYCGQPITAENMCKKVNALKEVLNRFTGNDDFFNDQCSEKCKRKGYVSILSELNIPKNIRGNLRIFTKGTTCHYKVERELSARWKTLSASEKTCSCLRKTCLE